MTTPEPADPQPAERSPSTLDRWVDHAVGWLPMCLVAVLVGYLVHRADAPVSDPDAWWHLRLGDELWHRHTLGEVPDWSARATVDWVPSEPLPEIVAARFHHWWGLPGVAWLYGASIVVVLLALYVACRRVAVPLAVAPALVLTLPVLSGSLTERPQLVSFVLLVVVQAAWREVQESHRPPWWLIPMTWFWSMCHGFWLIGVALSAVCWVGVVADHRATHRPDRRTAIRLAMVPLGSALVVLLSPGGPRVFLAPLAVNDTAQYISEWARTSFTSAWAVFGLIALVVTGLAMILQRRSLTTLDLVLFASAAFFLWYAERTVVLAGLVTAPLLAARLQQALGSESNRTPRRVEVGVLGSVAVGGLVFLAFAVPHSAQRPGDVPLGLETALDRIPAGTGVFNGYGLGGWLAWRYPDLDRTADGLVVPYDPDYIGDLLAAQQGRGDWRRTVAEADVEFAVLPEDATLVDRLRSIGWSTVDEADDYVLLAAPGVGLPAPGR